MVAALGWGALAAFSLVLGALLTFHRWSDRQVGAVLAFGAGALISAVSFELAAEGVDVGGADATAAGLAVGAITYFLADRALGRREAGGRGGGGQGPSLALGAFLDGVPEQFVLGVSVASGQGVSAALVVAIFVSNLPESIGSSSDMEESGISRKAILRLWLAVAVICTLSTLIGFAVADSTGPNLRAATDGFAAGALLVMLIDSMIPDAHSKAGRPAGLFTVLGFALAAGLSAAS
jgi:zinc transporter, ZIP family